MKALAMGSVAVLMAGTGVAAGDKGQVEAILMLIPAIQVAVACLAVVLSGYFVLSDLYGRWFHRGHG